MTGWDGTTSERESARLAEIERLHAAQPGTDRVLQEIVDDLREAFGADVCMANVVLADVQFFKAWSGRLPEELARVGRSPREQSMCRHVVETEAPLVVQDFLTTEAFREQHFRVRYGIRFYAGTPLVTSGGHVIGSLCLLHQRPIKFDDADLNLLGAFAKAVVGRLEALGALERERDAKRSERRILESITDAFFVLDREWRFVYVNAEAERILFKETVDLLGKNVRQELPEAVGFYNECRRAMDERATVEFEEYYPPLGAWFEVKAYPSEMGISVYFRDVTRRKHTEEALLASERRLRAVLVRYSSDVVTILEADGTIRYESPSVQGMLGHRPEEMVGQSVLDYVHPEDVSRAAGSLAAVAGVSGPSRPVEVRFKHKDGSWRWLEGVGSNLLADPDVRGIVVNSRDVTERKEAEARLKESEQRFRQLFEKSVDALFIHDERGRFVDCNPQATLLLGYSREELLSMSVWDVSEDMLTPEEKAQKEREGGTLWQRALSGVPGILAFSHEETNRRKDGTTLPVEVRVGSVEYGGRRMLLTSARDITERKRTEEALKRSEEKQRYRARELALLHQVRSAYDRELELPALLRAVVEGVAESYGYALVSTYLLEKGQRGTELVLQHQVGYERVIERLPTTEGVMGRVARTGRHALLKDVREDPAFLGAIEGITSEICVPLSDGGEVVGILNVESTGREVLTKEDLRLIETVAEHVGMAVGRARLHVRVREAEEQFRSAFENASAGAALVALDNRYLRVNRALCEMLGYPETELLTKVSWELTHPDELKKSEDRTSRMLSGEAEAESLEKRYVRKDGSVVWAISDVSLVRDGNGAPSHFIAQFQDITERKKLEEQLEYLALHDPLTGLPNRRLFMNRLEHALARAKRGGSEIAVLFMDLDDFKDINDSLGHDVGDRLLIAVAARLKRALRPADTAARFGGDEFTVLLEDVADAGDATLVAGRIAHELLANSFVVDGHEVSATPSIGIAMGGAGQDLSKDLLRKADIAMYRAKEEGASYRVFYPELGTPAR